MGKKNGTNAEHGITWYNIAGTFFDTIMTWRNTFRSKMVQKMTSPAPHHTGV
jgi:hypothetical protein